MRILVLLHDAYGGIGGIAKFNRDLLSALASHPRVAEVLTLPRLVPGPPGPIPEKITFDTRGAGSDLAYLATLVRLVARNRNVDLIISGHVNLIGPAWFCRLVTGAPMAAIIHGIDAWTPSTHAIANRLTRRLDFAISVSELTKSRFLAWAKLERERVFVLPNCVDPGAFAPGERDRALADRYGLGEAPVIMTLARLVGVERYKGIDEVLEIMPRLVARVPGLRYLIGGDGPDRARLEAKCRTLGIAGHVVFAGRIAELEKAAHYRLADVFVMPGRGEGFGIVYLEAMASGVPVIGSVLDGSREALLDGALGLLVDPRDPVAIEAAVVKALALPKGVPPGLEVFYYGNFEARVHRILETIVPESPGASSDRPGAQRSWHS